MIVCAMISLNSRTSISTNASHTQFDDAGPGEERRYGYGVEVNVAPPPVRVVEVPAPRMGYVWAPGYWNWNGREHVWVEGRWIGERRGQHWVPEDWVEHNGNWRLAQGHWER